MKNPYVVEQGTKEEIFKKEMWELFAWDGIPVLWSVPKGQDYRVSSYQPHDTSSPFDFLLPLCFLF